MTVIKAKPELRTILDFSIGKCSKHRIKQALHKCSIVNLTENNGKWTLHLNEIKIGMYTVMLILPFDSPIEWNKLKDYSDIEVLIYDNQNPGSNPINIKKDTRFKNQDWVNKNFFGQLRANHLVDIIAHCYRLNNLSAFM